MAGKTKKQGSRPQTPVSTKNTARAVQEAPLGHLGIKSGPYAPTDSKLTSQYMVRDHLVAHYRKLSKAKATVDTTPPKAWLYSQKVRDRAKRQALKSEIKRRDDWIVSNNSRPVSARASSRATSEVDRDEMFAMMASLNADERGMDEFDGRARADNNTTMEVNMSSSNATPQKTRLNDKDMKFVDKIVRDNEMSPGQYTYSKPIPSNIPAESLSARSRLGKTTPRDPDLMATQAHRYTNPEKPFTPRTLKTTQKSKLSEFKYYNPPKKRPSSLKAGSVVSRPETPMTADSVDLMNETLMSRDMNVRTPSGVPPLDISLDADHMKWLKDQAQKAQLRTTYRTRSDMGSELGSTRGGSTTRGFTLQRNGMDDVFMGDTQEHNLQTQSLSVTATQNMPREEEIKYLEFITDVTNDVLDRGIFTNRVLKQVFNAHIEKHKDHLKISKMRSMLEDLRVDLGIPAGNDDDDEGFGLSSQQFQREEMLSATSAMESHGMQNGYDNRSATVGVPHKSRRSQRMGAMGNDPLNTTQTFNAATLPHLRPRARGGGEGRPPLPRPSSRGSRSRPGSACSNTSYLQDVKELKEEESESRQPLKLNGGYGGSGQADILTIEHDVEEAHADADEPNDMNGNLDGNGLDENGVEENGVDEIDFNGTENTDDDLNKTSELTRTADFTNTQDSIDYSDDQYEDDDTLMDEPEPVSASDKPRPEPRKRSSLTPRSDQRETPRSSQGQTFTSGSVTVSELDDEENGDWLP